MANNPALHQRKSLRLKGYDYTQVGLYFITICTQHRAHLFGNINNGEMILNDAGNMISKWYYELENKFPDIKCYEMITMPNHFHCIIENVGTVGADLRVCPDNDKPQIINERRNDIMGNQRDILSGNQHGNTMGGRRGLTHNPSNITGERPGNITGERGDITGEHAGSPLHRVVQWFKTMSTNEYIRGVKNLGWPPFNGKLWQRNYWEHIIRNQNDYQSIANYIIQNPHNWDNDKLNK